MSVSISEILAGASVHAVPLAGECAGYLVLAAADQAVAAPRRIGPREVHLEGDGTVRVEGSRAAAEADSEGDLRALLDALLLRASSATPALLRASRRAPGRGIAALVREIETALIPVNRAAAHRALARLERETERARQAGRLDVASLEEARPSEPARVPAPAVVVVPEPRPGARFELPVVETDSEIPSLFAPAVEAIAAYAAEIETRPEPIVVRRSAPPPPLPARTPSPPPPVVSRRASPPPLPVAEAQPTTPVFGTIVRSYSDDEMDIEIVLDDELLDDELTSVLVRSAPLEVSVLLEASVSPDPTEPCPLAVDDELSDDAMSRVEEEAAVVASVADDGAADALSFNASVADDGAADALSAAGGEPADASSVAASLVEDELADASSAVGDEPAGASSVAEEEAVVAATIAGDEPAVASSVAEEEAVVAASIAGNEPAVAEEEAVVAASIAGDEPAVVEEEAVAAAVARDEPSDALGAFPPAPSEAFFEVESTSILAEAAEMPAADVPSDGDSAEASSVEVSSEPFSVEPDKHGETLLLALAVQPVAAELPPPPRLPMPKPRPSDVEDLLDRMTQANVAGGDDVRASLKGMAGIEPTPPPPAQASPGAPSQAARRYQYEYKYT